MAAPKKPLPLYTLSTNSHSYAGPVQTDAASVGVSLASYWKVSHFLTLEETSQARRMNRDARNSPPPLLHDGSMPLDHLVVQYWGLIRDGMDSPAWVSTLTRYYCWRHDVRCRIHQHDGPSLPCTDRQVAEEQSADQGSEVESRTDRDAASRS